MISEKIMLDISKNSNQLRFPPSVTNTVGYKLLSFYYSLLLSSLPFYNATFSEFEKRIFQPQTLPLFVLLVIILVTKTVILVFRHFSPHKSVFTVFKFIRQTLFCCFNRKKVYPVDSEGFLSGFELISLDDELRREVRYLTFCL